MIALSNELAKLMITAVTFHNMHIAIIVHPLQCERSYMFMLYKM